VGEAGSDPLDGRPSREGVLVRHLPDRYPPEEKLYFRLEDLIVIGDTGAEVVSEWLPLDVEALERTMREPGLLQRYPRDPEGLPVR
jgi:Xaa-Pro aminopeptidase